MVGFIANVWGVTGVCGRVTYFVCIVWRESMSLKWDCNWLVTVTPLASGDMGIDPLFFSIEWTELLLLPPLPLWIDGVGVLGTFKRGRAIGAATEVLLACWIEPAGTTWGLLRINQRVTLQSYEERQLLEQAKFTYEGMEWLAENAVKGRPTWWGLMGADALACDEYG